MTADDFIMRVKQMDHRCFFAMTDTVVREGTFPDPRSFTAVKGYIIFSRYDKNKISQYSECTDCVNSTKTVKGESGIEY